jgi:hypothetical protein
MDPQNPPVASHGQQQRRQPPVYDITNGGHYGKSLPPVTARRAVIAHFSFLSPLRHLSPVQLVSGVMGKFGSSRIVLTIYYIHRRECCGTCHDPQHAYG